MRVFVAIDIKPAQKLLDDWSHLKLMLGASSINWVDDAILHLTLKFLGEITPSVAKTVAESLATNLADVPKFQLTLRGYGTFGKPSPTVIWAGLDESPALRRVKLCTDKALADVGVEPDGELFNPHITLGRVKRLASAGSLSNFISENRNVTIQVADVGRVVLYQSTLTPKGAIYTELKSVVLV